MFKFAPLTQEASVCLRCQLRLSLRKGLRRDIPKRSSATPQQLRGFAPDGKLGQEQAILSDDGLLDEDLVAPVRKHDPFGPKWEGRSVPRTVSGHPKVKHLHRGHKDTLSFNALGEPAEVLVLDDGRVASEGRSDTVEVRSKRAAEDREINALSSSDMLDEIDAERGLADADQVFKNIEGVRNSWIAKSKSDPAVFSAAEHAEIASQLGRGFTIKQLVVYLDRADVNKPKGPLDLRYEFSSDLYSRSAWTSGTSSQRSRAPKLVRSGKDGKMRKTSIYEKSDRQLSAKSVLVERILRQYWQFNVRQDESSEGELGIRLHGPHLDLIMNHKRGILKQMSETYGARIQAYRHDRVLRVMSDHDTCLDVLKVIIFILENIRISDIEPMLLNNLKTALYFEHDTTMLKHVEQLTNTVIRAKSTTNRLENLRIYYLGPDDGDLQDVRRLISLITRPKPTDEGWLFCCGNVNEAETVPVPVDVGSGLALIHRNQQWSRWCSLKVRRIRAVEAERGNSASLNSLVNNAEAVNTLNKFLAPPQQHHELPWEANPYWQPNVVHLDSVTLGHVVFSGPSAAKRSAPNEAKTKAVTEDQIVGRLNKTRREFVSSIPGVFRLLEPLGSVASNPAIAEYMQIHLAPSLGTLPMPIEALPNLEIRIKLNNYTKTTSIEYVRLVHSKHLDFMLPRNTVDLRFIRDTSVYWQTEGTCDPRIQQFILDSNLDIWGTDRLRTPTELTLEIPAHAIRGHKEVAGEKVPGTMLVDYTFSSLEHRSSLLIPISKTGEWSNLTYTNVEAGKLGGRRDELTLTNPMESGNRLPSHENLNTIAQVTVAKNPDSATLLSRVNTLINAIENQPEHEYLAEAFTYGVEKERPQRVEEARGASRRTFRARHLALPGRTPSTVRKDGPNSASGRPLSR